MRPQADINVDDAEISRGNPALDPFLAWQYDLGFEYYFGENSEGLFSITAFIKDVENFIAPINPTEVIGFPELGIDPQEYVVETFAKGGTADIQGVEISFQTPFTFLHGIWSNFGTLINYTYIDSEFIDESGNSNPFPGTSENTFNAILFYEDGGFSTRLAYNFRDDFLQVPNSSGRNREFVEGTGRLDVGIRYRWESGWKLLI